MQTGMHLGWRRAVKSAGALLTVGMCAGLAAGCARVHARTVPERPPLDAPAPPPRDVEAVQAEVPQPVPLPEEPRRPPIRPRPAAPALQPPKTDAVKPEGAKGDGARAEAPKADVSSPVEEAAKAPTTLQTTPAAAQGEVERAIRLTMVRASADLKRIDYRALDTNARTQYDTAKRFIQQAEDAIRAKNLMLAKNLADKAATIAAQQAGR